MRIQERFGMRNGVGWVVDVDRLKGYVTDIREENVLQPLLVTSTAIKQAAECVRSILKIDDIVSNLFFFYCLCFPHVVAIEMDSGRGGEADERGCRG